jgi:hypothetical protein
VTRMRKSSNLHRILAGKSLGTHPFRRPILRWKDNTKMAGNDLRSCVMASFGIVGVELSGSTTTAFLSKPTFCLERVRSFVNKISATGDNVFVSHWPAGRGSTAVHTMQQRYRPSGHYGIVYTL